MTLASPTDYMLYSPLLPHVAAGVLNPSDIAVSLRRSLQRTLRAPCRIVGVDLDDRVCIARTILGEDHAVAGIASCSARERRPALSPSPVWNVTAAG